MQTLAAPARAGSKPPEAGAKPPERRSRRRRFITWFESRIPVTDTWLLNQRNIYIVPTKAGWAFAGMLLVMLLGSINYQLNLGYLLTFLLAGSALVSMHMTHGTLKGLTLHMRPVAPVFAGEPALVEVVLNSPGSTRHGVGVSFRDTRRFGWYQAFTDVPAHGQASAQLTMITPRRGRLALPTVTVETRFPLGLFRAWTIWRPAQTVLAYPAPETPLVALPAQRAAGAEASHQRASDGGEFDGVRAWRRGDSLRQVVWKKAAKTGELVSRDTSTSTSRELWLDWQAARVPGAGVEARLSRLSAWVQAAHRAGHSFGMQLPGREFAPHSSDAHRRQLLEALALWR